MRTSRVAKDTSKVVSSLSTADYVPRRQTRAVAARLRVFSAVKDEAGVEVSNNVLDIEDSTIHAATSRKRKRAHTGPPTTAATSTITTTRSSPRKSGLKEGNDSANNSRKARRQPAKRITGQDGEVKISPPSQWEEIYEAVREMRKEKLAPVDTMGCETLAQEELSAKDQRFQTLIALMLSSQTKDTTNAIAMRRLQTELPAPGLTLQNILKVDPVKLNEMIYVVGFHNTKTKHIKLAAEILRDQFKGDIPDTIEGLMSLPGVGPKMGYLCMSAAWGKTIGIGVDVHVHRITNLWRWHKTKGPEETRAMLEGWLPRERWHEINHLLVGFGQTVCTPVGRRCGECTLSQRGLCPSAVVVRKEVKKKRKVDIDVDEKEGILKHESKVEVAVKEEDIRTD
ncbi:uncharacterized protein KY384_008383 [Bacidia gigantensis]|uniref:uncharacterized protein n=1 Tax=Bacidia gigantensis TaxID=2732470 RepID=UPI001D05AD9E|nr:uncharacterized protein KY384_008383 [Bacidia gigantensis]KAG8526954.1 hypothetical protein KY384_008383 [Bacidia gigantensis]